MGKLVTTMQSMREFRPVVIGVGYCQFEVVLNHKSPIACNSGVNGLNCDLYDFQSYAIVTGHNYGKACTHRADGNFVRWLSQHFQKAFPDLDSVEAKASAKSIYPQMLYWHTTGAFDTPRFVRNKPDAYQFLKRWGTCLRPVKGTDGTVHVYDFLGKNYYVLCDNTVITEQEWNND